MERSRQVRDTTRHRVRSNSYTRPNTASDSVTHKEADSSACIARAGGLWYPWHYAGGRIRILRGYF